MADYLPKSTEQPAKKFKPLEPTLSQESTSSAGSSSSTALAKSWIYGKTSLNAIPFSLSAFEGSLSEEERDLLELECKTIRLSWCARSMP